MIHAVIERGKVQPLTENDKRELEKLFPDGNVILNSDNCPELAAAIEEQSKLLLEQNKLAYEALARYD